MVEDLVHHPNLDEGERRMEQTLLEQVELASVEPVNRRTAATDAANPTTIESDPIVSLSRRNRER
jgi:hypothetical protein